MTNYYTSGEFAKKAKVTIRTIRYYDKQGILKPSFINESGYRVYTDEDFGKLQKILSLKSLGFSLQEIVNMTISEDKEDIANSLQMQVSLLRRKIEQFQTMEQALLSTMNLIQETNQVDWQQILKLIHLSNMEQSLVEQYKNEANLDIRITLHECYSINKTGWFPWLMQQIELSNVHNLLEIGCGNGKLWTSTNVEIPGDIALCITDSSEGMVKDASFNIRKYHKRNKITCHKEFKVVDCEHIPYAAEQFDTVIANHVLFYVHNMEEGLKEISRVLKQDGVLHCSTYGRQHMQEINKLVQEFDPRISLSDVPLYEQFGLNNGAQLLSKYFREVELRIYEDELVIDCVDPLIQYILSCHGNQSEILSHRQEEFRQFLQGKLEKMGEIRITKEAGVFVCKK